MKKNSLLSKLKNKRATNKLTPTGLVAVLSHKNEIKEGLSKGFTLREIHSILVEENEMPVKYSAFTRLVKIHIKENKTHSEEKKASNKPRVFDPKNYEDEDIY